MFPPLPTGREPHQRRNPNPFRLDLETLECRNLPSPPYGPWGPPVNLGSVVNSAASDQHPAISKDGLSLYITTSRLENADDLVLDDNIWVSRRASVDEPWGAPVELGPAVNTGSNDRTPTFSRDAHWMFFGSNRPGLGGLDLWASYRQDVHDDFAWQSAVNLGPSVNTSTDEDGATLFRDDETGVTTLIFTSFNRAGYPGTDWDIYASTQNPDGTFGPAVPVANVNRPGGPADARDTRTAIRHDGQELFITTNRPGGRGLIDLWVSTRETTADPWSVPVNLGEIVNGAANDGAPALSSDGETLFFYSNRDGGSGGNDLYMTTRTKLHGRHGCEGSVAAVELSQNEREGLREFVLLGADLSAGDGPSLTRATPPPTPDGDPPPSDTDVGVPDSDAVQPATERTALPPLGLDDISSDQWPV